MTAGTEMASGRKTEADDLRAQLNALKSSLVSSELSISLPWSLSPIERAIFGMLLAQDVVSKKTIVLLLHNRQATASDLKNVDVFISRIRAKTNGENVNIETIFGVGYRLEGRESWRATISQGATARH